MILHDVSTHNLETFSGSNKIGLLINNEKVSETCSRSDSTGNSCDGGGQSDANANYRRGECTSTRLERSCSGVSNDIII